LRFDVGRAEHRRDGAASRRAPGSPGGRSRPARFLRAKLLYTGQRLTHLIDWYARNGYEVERAETLPDRTVIHMLKQLDHKDTEIS